MEASPKRKCGCGYVKGSELSKRAPPHCPVCHCRIKKHSERWGSAECIPCDNHEICGHQEQHEDKILRNRSKLSPQLTGSKRNSDFVDSLVRAKKM